LKVYTVVDQYEDWYRSGAGKNTGLVKTWLDLPNKSLDLVLPGARSGSLPYEAKAKAQIEMTSCLPFIYKHVAVMPDVHYGMGCSIGTVIPTKGAIIPAAVGVDIGCGMIAVDLGVTADSLPPAGSRSELMRAIQDAVPHGRTNRGQAGDRGAWANVPGDVQAEWDKPRGHRNEGLDDRSLGWQLSFVGDTHGIKGNSLNHLGTLGTGNHFIEICVSDSNKVWAMIHSGSRGIGNAIARHFIKKAQDLMAQYHISLPNKDLAYFAEGTQEFNDYLDAVDWAQTFAWASREIMLRRVVDAVRKHVPAVPHLDFAKEAVHCHHNYVTRENHFGSNVWITRKGAICARRGMLGIIPGSMGSRSFIARGLGNADSFMSCSHGAGRVMSRTEARKTITVDQHIVDTQGVVCDKSAGVLDESPRAYKDIDEVMAAQKDLVEVVHTLKQVICVKG